MDTLKIYPQSKDQSTALKAVMKAMKIPFEQKKGLCPDHVINGVKQSLKESNDGYLTPYTGIRDMLTLA